MGQVYRATDTTLGRQVAIKILPDAFASDPERLVRFEREAKTLASLNHPHIAAIYGFEKSAGLHALVMELVEGEDLSQPIARGAIAIDEALPIAKQIAEALEAAHEQGIVHRDLKPANIKVRSDGTVKVLDFGLAKATEPAASSSPALAMSPTITSTGVTEAGMILGTAAYMSPEQARGKSVDKRSDIWAFGLVLYEMLTGRAAFAGDTITDVLAAIVTREPDWTTLPATTPASVRRLLARCLEKDRSAGSATSVRRGWRSKRRPRAVPDNAVPCRRLLPTPDPARHAPLAHASRRSPGHRRASHSGRSPSAPSSLSASGRARARPKRARCACRSSTPRALKSPRPRFRRTAGSWRIAHDEATACR